MQQRPKPQICSTALWMTSGSQAGVMLPHVGRVRAVVGRRRLRRVITTEAVWSLTADHLLRAFPCLSRVIEKQPLYFDPVHGFLNIVPFQERARVEVNFVRAKQGRIQRWLMICPGCQRQVRSVASVLTSDRYESGCRQCLGLVYPSQAHHKTERGDRKRLENAPQGQKAAFQQANEREDRRVIKLVHKIAALLGKSADDLIHSEADPGQFCLAGLSLSRPQRKGRKK